MSAVIYELRGARGEVGTWLEVARDHMAESWVSVRLCVCAWTGGIETTQDGWW